MTIITNAKLFQLVSHHVLSHKIRFGNDMTQQHPFVVCNITPVQM